MITPFKCAFVLFITLSKTSGLPDGAPLDACQQVTLVQVSGSPQSNSQTPYFVTANQETSSGPGVKVALQSTSGSVPFSGFSLQARLPGNSLPFGRWDILKIDPLAKVTNCKDFLGSVLTNVDNATKQRVEGVWLPPGQFINDEPIEFYATVVQDFNTYWVNIKSNPVFLGQPQGASATIEPAPEATDQSLLNLPSPASTMEIATFDPSETKDPKSTGCHSKPIGTSLVLVSLAIAFT